MAWPNSEQPFGVNHAPLLSGLASDGSGVEVPVAVDKDTGEVLVSGGSAATSVAINDGVTTSTKASVVESSADPGTFGLVALNPDGSDISGGGGGGGTSSNFGAAFPTAGTAAGATDGTDMQPLHVDGSGNLKVSQQGTVTISGTVTANAGTNLNTSLLALESGGNLAGINGKISAAAALADSTANPTIGGVQVFPMGYNGSTWDRLHAVFLSSDNQGVQTGLYTLGQNLMYNGTNWDRIRGDTTNGQWVNVKASVSTAPTAVRYGQATVSVTSTAVQLTSGALTGNGGVIIQALAANAGNVVIGDSSVTTANGFQLQPGQAMGVNVDNVNRLYVNGTSGDGVCWIGS